MALCLAAVCAARPAVAFTEAGEAYAYPTFTELAQATAMLGGYDMSKDELITEYIRLMFCDVFKQNVTDEFSWHEVKNQFRERLKRKRDYYRSLYQIDGVIILGQYDFARKQFPLVDGTAFDNVGYMSLLDPKQYKPYCLYNHPTTGQILGGVGTFFAKTVNIVLTEPFSFTTLKLTQNQAQDLLDKIARYGDTDVRRIFIRFRFRVQSVAGSRVNTRSHNYFQADLAGEIISVDLFYDKEMTKWLMRIPLRLDATARPN